MAATKPKRADAAAALLFGLAGNPTATGVRFSIANQGQNYAMVLAALHMGPIGAPQTAVREAIVAKRKAQQ